MTDNIRRLGVFCFYDEEGIVDSYVEFLIKNLRVVLTKLIIIVNGNINQQGKEIFQKYAGEVIIRENIGYDLGAYRDVIVNTYENNKMCDWDEVVLCNDTFYGPFISFSTIFSYMEKMKADFWGINFIENGFLSHIQSYFLVFRKKIVREGDLYSYMCGEELSAYLQDNNLADIYAFFEIGLFNFLEQKGYTYAAYTNTEHFDIYAHPDLCIKKCKLPILKKKCFSQRYYKKDIFSDMLVYIDKEFGYDHKMIIQNAERKYDYINRDKLGTNEKKYSVPSCYYPQPIEKEAIITFTKFYSDIYIYGTGVYARKVWFLFHKYIKNFRGFVVSDNQNRKIDFLYGYPINFYRDIKKGSAIIIGCDLDNTKEIVCGMKKEDNVCPIWEEVNKLLTID